MYVTVYGEIQQKRPVFRSPPTFVSKTCFCPTQIINRASLNDKICVKPQSNELHVFWRMYTVDEMIFGRRCDDKIHGLRHDTSEYWFSDFIIGFIIVKTIGFE